MATHRSIVSTCIQVTLTTLTGEPGDPPPPPHTWRGVLPTDPGYGMGTACPRLADRTLPTKWHCCYYTDFLT